VIPVSPNTFYAYLQVILLGLRGLQISEEAKRILGQLQQMELDVERFSAEYAKIGNHLRDAQNCFARTEERLARLKSKLALVSSEDFEETKT
jgi:DNA recombination protein RmuC